ncbi:efflux RND transporter periplasmic adaptor subunit [Nostoc sp. UHCC 0870]|uniref:efflux RND transporter periplasmic adaptor subunit n=1 Tax=Nostoc sp. UHCC 0870 TaxID=2914041 RepID=UPI001EDE5CB2|nr:efflux RND transporter periplasmic adaptor subunit [Nostoc sp. UHCC 0870]UKO96320.1 efflux RND transporter periplasmic adaptor subunit [Nostoc sp. UHCC 0870]
MKQQTYTPIGQLINTHSNCSVENHTQKSRVSYFLFIACLFSMGILTASCGSLPKESATAQPQQNTRGGGGQATPVDVAIARIDRLQPQIEYTGTTTPFQIISLRSQAEGRLLSLNSDVGDTVKKGQTVGRLDDTLLLTNLKQAEAELAALQSEVARAKTQVSNARAEVERARLELVQAQADANRQQKLFKEGAISEQLAEQANTKAQTAAQALRATEEQVRTAQQAVAAAQGRVFAQKAVLAQAQERRSYTRLTSPLTGVVTEKVTEPGNLLQAGGEALKIGDFSRIKVVVQVSELELSQIQVGQSVQVRLDAFPQEKLIGRVTRISPTADATARLIPVEVVIPNSNNNIGSGLLARVNFAPQTPQRVVVSQTALQKSAKITPPGEVEEQNGKLYVVKDSEGKTKVTARAVTLGKKADGKVEILSGLQPGDRYVVRSGKPLKDGETVRLSILSDK